MDNLTALKELIRKLEAGTAITNDAWYAVFNSTNYSAEKWFNIFANATSAYRGDETAAFALKREVLGDRWDISIEGGKSGFAVAFHCTNNQPSPMLDLVQSQTASLPTAILIATLKALIFELEAVGG